MSSSSPSTSSIAADDSETDGFEVKNVAESVRLPTKRSRGTPRIPAHAGRLLGMANVAYVNEKYDEAIRLLQQVVREVGGYAEPFRTLGLVYEAKGERIRALDSFLIAASLAQRDVDAWKNVARLAYAMGEYKKAAHAFSRALRYSEASGSRVAPPRSRKDRVYRLLQQGSECDADLLVHLASCHLMASNTRDGKYRALRTLLTLCGFRPGDANIALGTAHLCLRLGRLTPGCQVLERCLAQHATDAAAVAQQQRRSQQELPSELRFEILWFLGSMYLRTAQYASCLELLSEWGGTTVSWDQPRIRLLRATAACHVPLAREGLQEDIRTIRAEQHEVHSAGIAHLIAALLDNSDTLTQFDPLTEVADLCEVLISRLAESASDRATPFTEEDSRIGSRTIIRVAVRLREAGKLPEARFLMHRCLGTSVNALLVTLNAFEVAELLNLLDVLDLHREADHIATNIPVVVPHRRQGPPRALEQRVRAKVLLQLRQFSALSPEQAHTTSGRVSRGEIVRGVRALLTDMRWDAIRCFRYLETKKASRSLTVSAEEKQMFGQATTADCDSINEAKIAVDHHARSQKLPSSSHPWPVLMEAASALDLLSPIDFVNGSVSDATHFLDAALQLLFSSIRRDGCSWVGCEGVRMTMQRINGLGSIVRWPQRIHELPQQSSFLAFLAAHATTLKYAIRGQDSLTDESVAMIRRFLLCVSLWGKSSLPGVYAEILSRTLFQGTLRPSPAIAMRYLTHVRQAKSWISRCLFIRREATCLAPIAIHCASLARNSKAALGTLMKLESISGPHSMRQLHMAALTMPTVSRNVGRGKELDLTGKVLCHLQSYAIRCSCEYSTASQATCTLKSFCEDEVNYNVSRLLFSYAQQSGTRLRCVRVSTGGESIKKASIWNQSVTQRRTHFSWACPSSSQYPASYSPVLW